MDRFRSTFRHPFALIAIAVAIATLATGTAAARAHGGSNDGGDHPPGTTCGSDGNSSNAISHANHDECTTPTETAVAPTETAVAPTATSTPTCEENPDNPDCMTPTSTPPTGVVATSTPTEAPTKTATTPAGSVATSTATATATTSGGVTGAISTATPTVTAGVPAATPTIVAGAQVTTPTTPSGAQGAVAAESTGPTSLPSTGTGHTGHANGVLLALSLVGTATLAGASGWTLLRSRKTR